MSMMRKHVEEALSVCKYDPTDCQATDCPYYGKVETTEMDCIKHLMNDCRRLAAMTEEGWHNAKIDPPEYGVEVLCVKETKAKARSICFGTCWNNYAGIEGDRWVTSGGCNNVLYWMPLPNMPTE